MPSVLGKRTRGAADTAGSNRPMPRRRKCVVTDNVAAETISTRSKRRIVLNEPNDENENPFASHDEHGADGTEVDEITRPTKKTRASTRTVPSKHGAPERRVGLSPVKISEHFKASKAAVAVFQDAKSNSKPSPQTPRHRDAQARKVSITPRHRALLAGSQSTPRTPRTPVTPSNATTSVYNQARQLFSRCSNPGKLVGRDSERQELSLSLIHI